MKILIVLLFVTHNYAKFHDTSNHKDWKNRLQNSFFTNMEEVNLKKTV